MSVIPVRLTNGETALLAGMPRMIQPYSSLQETGEIQLSVIARQNRQPPGFNETWFYSDFWKQALNRDGNFIFIASVRDAVSPNTTENTSIWRVGNNGQPRLKAMEGMKVHANGQDKILHTIDIGGVAARTNTSGKHSQFSDTGDYLFTGSVDFGPAILMIPDDRREQRIFALAEQLFPQFFAPANAEDRLLEGFEYRFYSATKTPISASRTIMYSYLEHQIGRRLHISERLTKHWQCWKA